MLSKDLKKWESGMATDGTYINIRVPLVENVIEYEKTDSKGRTKTIKINRLATLLGKNGFGSFLLGHDNKGNQITISLKINKVSPSQVSDDNNSDFDLG